MKAGWEVKALEDCLDPFEVAAKIPRQRFEPAGVFPIVSQEAEFINGYWNDEADVSKVVRPVVVFGDHTQVLKFIDFDFVVGADGVKVLNPKNFLNAKFLAYFIEANPFPSLGYARHYRHVRSLPIPLPPLDEQKRIVEVLDAAFEGLSRARAHTETNLQNARELFESGLDYVFADYRSPEFRTKIGKIGDVFDGPHATPKTIDEGPLFLGISSLVDGQLDLSSTRHVTEQDYATWTRRVTPIGGDVVFSYETRLGQAALIPEGLRCCLGRRMGLVRLDRTKVLPEFFLFQYLAPTYQAYLRSKTVEGATVDRIHLKFFPDFDIFVPPIEDQRKVVGLIREFVSTSNRVTEAQKTKLADLDALRQALLQKAFAGELT